MLKYVLLLAVVGAPALAFVALSDANNPQGHYVISNSGGVETAQWVVLAAA
jgi:hypothetical protein